MLLKNEEGTRNFSLASFYFQQLKNCVAKWHSKRKSIQAKNKHNNRGKTPWLCYLFHFNVPRALGAVKVRFRWKCANRKLGNLAIWSKVQQFIDTVLFLLFLQISESKYCFPVLFLIDLRTSSSRNKLKNDSVPKMLWTFTVWIDCSRDLKSFSKVVLNHCFSISRSEQLRKQNAIVLPK